MGKRKKKKAKKVSAHAARLRLWRGVRTTSISGLPKSNFMKNKRGTIVSKKSYARGKQLYKKYLAGWTKSLMQARKNLRITGKCMPKKGSALYKEARRLYDASK